MKMLRVSFVTLALGVAISGPATAADGPITVWVDATRQPAVEVFKTAHPEIPITMVVDDGSSGGSGTFQTKVGLADQAGSGWPDVVFSTQTNDAAWTSQDTNGTQAFAQVLNQGFFDKDFLAGFTPGALDPATVGGKVYGLRNDLAPVVLWYNKDLLSRFGYDVPKTWEDYQALGDKLAKDHSGYFLGALGDSFEGPYVYYWSGQAPVFQLKGETFRSDVGDPNTRKVTALIDHMLKSGALTQDSIFSAAFVAKADHLVAIPGPVWYSGALFQNTAGVNAKPGTWGVAPPLVWTGGGKVTGNVGGGIWYVSSHTASPQSVKTFLQFVLTDDRTAGTGGLPAYQAAGDRWLAKQAASGFYAGDITSAISTAATTVWSGWGYPNFSPETAWAKIIIPGLAGGKTVADLSAAWQQEMRNEAQVQGYQAD